MKLQKQISVLKCNVSYAKLKETEAKKQMELMRKKQIKDAQVEIPQDDLDALVRKHGGATKKIAPTRNSPKKAAPAAKQKKDVEFSSSDDSDGEETKRESLEKKEPQKLLQDPRNLQKSIPRPAAHPTTTKKKIRWKRPVKKKNQ